MAGKHQEYYSGLANYSVMPVPPSLSQSIVSLTSIHAPQDLRGMIKELLISYYKSTGSKKPKRLLFYRDGVSEGQFAEVSRTEIPQVSLC